MSFDSSQATLLAVGDVGFAGRVMRRVREDEHSDYPFAHSLDTLARGDLVLGNLEIPLIDATCTWRAEGVPATLTGTIEAAPRLRAAGFHVLGLANNHIMDYGADGLRTTIRAMRNHGIEIVGAGENLAAARTPAVVERAGTRFGILAYTSSRTTWAKRDSPGAAPLSAEIVEEDLRRARSRVDVVILSLHFGVMYTDYPRVQDQAFLRRLSDLGADVVLGHHPHVLQGFEQRNNRLIAYSLGEFLFDPEAGNVVAEAHRNVRRESVVLSCTFNGGRLEKWNPIPFLASPELSPYPALGSEGAEIRERIRRISAPLEGDGLASLDLDAHAGARLAGHEMRVLWFLARNGQLAPLLGKLSRIRPRHLRMLRGWLTGNR